MADLMPDYFVSQQQIVAQIASLKANYEKQKLENMQLAKRMRDNDINMEATITGIAREETTLTDLIKIHGTSDNPKPQSPVEEATES